MFIFLFFKMGSFVIKSVFFTPSSHLIYFNTLALLTCQKATATSKSHHEGHESSFAKASAGQGARRKTLLTFHTLGTSNNFAAYMAIAGGILS
jgi:hypothetical protein